MSETFWSSSFFEAQHLLQKILADPDFVGACHTFGALLEHTFKNQHHVLICGNGGSHCDAMHFAEECTGRFMKDRPALGALALGDAAHTTCVANDFGFDQVFARQVAALGRPGDVLVVLSTSGNSPNILKALEQAKRQNMPCVALLGRDGGQAKALADLALVVPHHLPHRIQEMHIKILHTAVAWVDQQLFSEQHATQATLNLFD